MPLIRVFADSNYVTEIEIKSSVTRCATSLGKESNLSCVCGNWVITKPAVSSQGMQEDPKQSLLTGYAFGDIQSTAELPKVCSLQEWCFIISIEVSSDHSQLRCTGFAGSH